MNNELSFEYCGRQHELSIGLYPTPLRNKEVDIILPVFNDTDLFLHAFKWIKHFTDDGLYNLYILNNGSTDQECLDALQQFIDYFAQQKKHNIGIISHKTIGTTWGGSESHGLGLNSIIGSGLLTSKNIFLMHADSAPLAPHWMDYMIGKINQGNMAVGTYTNWSDQQGIGYLHCSGVLIDREFATGIDYCPKKPDYDTIGALTKKLINTGSKYFVCKNSRNEPELRKFHAYGHEKGSESFDDDMVPCFSHAGRGSSRGDVGGFIR